MATVVGMGLASLPASGDGWPPNTFLANYVTNVYVTEATQLTGTLCTFIANQRYTLQLEISWDGKNVTLVSPDPSDHAGMQATFLFSSRRPQSAITPLGQAPIRKSLFPVPHYWDLSHSAVRSSAPPR
jgi:hypothetical protein